MLQKLFSDSTVEGAKLSDCIFIIKYLYTYELFTLRTHIRSHCIPQVLPLEKMDVFLNCWKPIGTCPHHLWVNFSPISFLSYVNIENETNNTNMKFSMIHVILCWGATIGGSFSRVSSSPSDTQDPLLTEGVEALAETTTQSVETASKDVVSNGQHQALPDGSEMSVGTIFHYSGQGQNI